MLKLFEVTGFRNFRDSMKLDFTDVRNYDFNTDCISDGMVGKAIVYGKNAIGKTNFGLALCDIASTRLRRGNVAEEDYFDATYLNASNKKGYAEFRYVFQFGKDEVEYLYRRDGYRTLRYEKVVFNDNILFEYDRDSNEITNTKGLKSLSPTLVLNFEGIESVFTYAVSNTALDIMHPLKQTLRFISGMIFIPSIVEIRSFRFFPRRVHTRLLEGNNLEKLQNLFNEVDIHLILEVIKDSDGTERLYAKENRTAAPRLFNEVASSGTIALYDFFMRSTMMEERRATVAYLDEFDAFYHAELAEMIVRRVKKMASTQVIITSHNTNLLSSRFMRPDCYFIMTQSKLTSFVNATSRELREGHDLEKLYRSGEFDER